ncbi:D-alanyl-D-alanine carboxypeptidase family protein [Kitasatospora sp. NPDC057738]|uniref:D-alanyl-D-alanine carboxypeptidase family protein n=1 Tax=Kitasatospora sp. NPDC057738 TaxID=3346233 RepID=UPI00368F10C4
MGESPDRVLRDGDERQRDRERERTGTAASAAGPAEGGSGTAADGPSATAADEATAETSSDTSSDSPAEASGEAAPKAPADAPEAAPKGGSTVQLRVRDVDSRTTMLRLPVDNSTTALRLPDELVKAAGKGSSEGGEGEKATSPETAEETAPAGRPVAADPRLAMRTGATAAGKAGRKAAEPSGETGSEGDSEGGPGSSAAPAGTADEAEKAADEAADNADNARNTDNSRKADGTDGAGGAERTGKAEQTGSAEKSEQTEKTGKTGDAGTEDDPEDTGDPEDAEDADAEDAPAIGSVTLALTRTGQPGQRPDRAEKLEKPAPPRASAAGTAAPAGTVPEPKPEPRPEPGPVPEPEPTPGRTPLPKPAPVPAPVPAPKPLPEPDPRPVPPVPPLPKPEPLPAPEPLPSPENTAEAMEVLASLNARPVSPLRRALKRVTIWTVFLAVVLGALAVAQLLRPLPDPKLKMTAAGSYSFSGDVLDLAWPAKGQSAAEVVGVGSLGSSGQETPSSIASVTKVMNAYLILQKFPLKKGESGPKITVDKQAAQESGNVDESRVTLTEGQVLTEYQALELLMLPSANNVARLLARFHSGSEAEFVKLMNDTSAKFGMANTIYADPAGFSADTKSTAKDQLKLAEQVMQDEIFRQIVSTPETNFNNAKISNTNNLINPKTGVIGVKTGSSTPAGGCLMWAAYKEIGGVQRLILGVTLGQQATSPNPGDGILPTVLKVSGKQIQAAQNGVTGQVVVKKGDVVGSVEDGLGGKVAVVATKDLVVAGFPGISGTVTLDTSKIDHRGTAGMEVGVLRVGAGDGKAEVPVALQSDLNPPSIQSRLLRTL